MSGLPAILDFFGHNEFLPFQLRDLLFIGGSEPMRYLEFWTAIAPYNLVLQDLTHCDWQIATGEVDETIMLIVLKHMARVELTKPHDLSWKPVTPWVQLVESH